jgi:hypothetical protein
MDMKFLKRLQKFAFDLLFIAGCAVFVYGIDLAWRPAGYMCAGIILAALAFFLGYKPAAASGAESEE